MILVFYFSVAGHNSKAAKHLPIFMHSYGSDLLGIFKWIYFHEAGIEITTVNCRKPVAIDKKLAREVLIIEKKTGGNEHKRKEKYFLRNKFNLPTQCASKLLALRCHVYDMILQCSVVTHKEDRLVKISMFRSL